MFAVRRTGGSSIEKPNPLGGRTRPSQHPPYNRPVAVYADLIRYRELFASLFQRDLRAKYKGSVLGLVWTLALPVTLMLVYLVVFSVMWKSPTTDFDHYWLFLLCGLPPWVFFATSLQSSARSLLENASLIRKVRFPRQLVPLSIVATQLGLVFHRARSRWTMIRARSHGSRNRHYVRRGRSCCVCQRFHGLARQVEMRDRIHFERFELQELVSFGQRIEGLRFRLL